MCDDPVTLQKGKKPQAGPGSYDIPTFPDVSPVVPCSASFSMSSSGRSDKGSRTYRAGPGAYYPKVSVTEPRQRCYGFGRARRILSEISAQQTSAGYTPAPQLGHTDSAKFTKAPVYGFGTQEKFFPHGGRSARGQKIPGPGEHNPSDHFTSKASPTPKWGTPRRDDTTPRKSRDVGGPGPGMYKAEESFCSISQQNAPRYGFGTTARPSASETKSKAPGPGSYSTCNTTRTGHSSVGDGAPRWTISGRTNAVDS